MRFNAWPLWLVLTIAGLLTTSTRVQAYGCPEWFAQIFPAKESPRPSYQALLKELPQIGDPETFIVRIKARAAAYRKANPKSDPLNYPLPENSPALAEVNKRLRAAALNPRLQFEDEAQRLSVQKAHARARDGCIEAIEKVEAAGYRQVDSVSAMRMALSFLDRYDDFVSVRRLDHILYARKIPPIFEGDEFLVLLRQEAAAFDLPATERDTALREFQSRLFDFAKDKLKKQGIDLDVQDFVRREIIQDMTKEMKPSEKQMNFHSASRIPMQFPFLFVAGDIPERAVIEARLFGGEIIGISPTQAIADRALNSRAGFFDHDAIHALIANSSGISNKMVARSTRWKRQLLSKIDSLPAHNRHLAEAITMFALREGNKTETKHFVLKRYTSRTVQAAYESVYGKTLDAGDADWMAAWANSNLPTRGQ